MKTLLKTYKDKNGNTIRIEVGTLPLSIKKKDSCWVAYSPDFKTLGFSEESEEDAIHDFSDSLDIFFDVHLERGTLAKALLIFGWKKQNDTFKKRKYFNHPKTHSEGQRHL